MRRIPRPVPDTSKLPMFHYKDVFDSCGNDHDDESRPTDDWQPRHNIKLAFKNGTLKLGDEDGISLFSSKYIVEKKLVEDYLLHLTTLARTKNIRESDRKEKRQEREQKSFEEYDWDMLVKTGAIQKLKVKELEKYLKHFNLSVRGKKADKVRRVLAHVYSTGGVELDNHTLPEQDPKDPDSDPESSRSSSEESESDEDDLVIAYQSSEPEDSTESDSSDDESFQQVIKVIPSRSRRNIRPS